MQTGMRDRGREAPVLRRGRVGRAARLKAGHSLSYPAAFCAALSQLSSFPMVTGDPEFLQLEGLISIRWIA